MPVIDLGPIGRHHERIAAGPHRDRCDKQGFDARFPDKSRASIVGSTNLPAGERASRRASTVHIEASRHILHEGMKGVPRSEKFSVLRICAWRLGFLAEPAQAISGAPVHDNMRIASSPAEIAAPKPTAQKPASAQALAALASSSSPASGAREASETPAQTAQEAAHGDQQAVRLQAARARAVAHPSPPGTAKLVKVTA